MAVDYAIEIKNLSKTFQKPGSPRSYSTLKSLFTDLLKPKSESEKEAEQIKALRNLTLRIPQGASVGIIGRNGSGKSTLLKLITGIYKPTTGGVFVDGRIAALIELGAGFHPDFTGRENLMLGGIMHGLSRSQIEERFEDIVSFAELEKVIDAPVRTYSSGMFMRLGFSLAVHTDPNVLLVDEVLAVGDAGFVRKCKERITAMRKSGVTLLLVTHDLDAVERWCDEVLWLNKGQVMERGEPRRVLDAYRTFIEESEEEQLQEEVDEEALEEDTAPQTFEEPSEEAQETERWGSRDIEIQEIEMLNAKGERHNLFSSDEEVTIRFTYRVNEASALDDLVFGVAIERVDGLQIFGTNTDIDGVTVPELAREGEVRIRVERFGLLDSKYRLDIAAHRGDGYPYDYHKGAQFFLLRSRSERVGIVSPEQSWDFSAAASGGKQQMKVGG